MDGDAWSSVDAWVLIAVTLSGRGDLKGVIAGGDVCNHAILSREELEWGIGRLAAAGIIEVRRGPRFGLTRLGKRVARGARGGSIERHVQMGAQLERVVPSRGHYSIADSHYDKALASYYRRVNEWPALLTRVARLWRRSWPRERRRW